jgi:putative Holliday junction resolvase
MYRILAIDYGQKNVGLALTDPMRMFAKPYMTLQNKNQDYLIQELKTIIKSQNVEKVVLGLPISVAGLDTQKTKEVREFYNLMKETIIVDIVLWDERYTTMDAKELLENKGMSIKESRKIIDQTAAALLLKNYLEVNKDA